MVHRNTLRTVAVSAAVTVLVILLFIGVWLRKPIYLLYNMRTEVVQKERRLLYHTNHKQLAVELRQFATERRWNEGNKRSSPDFYYGDDLALPPAVRAIGPSWVQISDDRIDVGCGEFMRDGSRSFGISVWRADFRGWGTKKLDEGVWFYSQNSRIPSRFAIPFMAP